MVHRGVIRINKASLSYLFDLVRRVSQNAEEAKGRGIILTSMVHGSRLPGKKEM